MKTNNNMVEVVTYHSLHCWYCAVPWKQVYAKAPSTTWRFLWYFPTKDANFLRSSTRSWLCGFCFCRAAQIEGRSAPALCPWRDKGWKIHDSSLSVFRLQTYITWSASQMIYLRRIRNMKSLFLQVLRKWLYRKGLRFNWSYISQGFNTIWRVTWSHSCITVASLHCKPINPLFFPRKFQRYVLHVWPSHAVKFTAKFSKLNKLRALGLQKWTSIVINTTYNT
jgi:hypothetical protein